MKIVPRIVVLVIVLALCVVVLPVSAAPSAQVSPAWHAHGAAG